MRERGRSSNSKLSRNSLGRPSVEQPESEELSRPAPVALQEILDRDYVAKPDMTAEYNFTVPVEDLLDHAAGYDLPLDVDQLVFGGGKEVLSLTMITMILIVSITMITIILIISIAMITLFLIIKIKSS